MPFNLLNKLRDWIIEDYMYYCALFVLGILSRNVEFLLQQPVVSPASSLLKPGLAASALANSEQ